MALPKFRFPPFRFNLTTILYCFRRAFRVYAARQLL